MQAVKDTFYVALRDRVAAGNPARTMVVRGAVRPGILVEENELATGAAPLAGLMCSIRYAVDGDAASAGMDRGRMLAQMDAELGKALATGVRHAAKESYATGSAVAAGGNVFWGEVAFGPAVTAGERLERTATVEVFGYLEAEA